MIEHGTGHTDGATGLSETRVEIDELPIQLSQKIPIRTSLRQYQFRRLAARWEVAKRDDDELLDVLLERTRSHRAWALLQPAPEAGRIPCIGQAEVFNDAGDRPFAVNRGIGLFGAELANGVEESVAGLLNLGMHH